MGHLSRRNFTRLVTAGGAGTFLLPLNCFSKNIWDTKYYKNIGIQLWSVGELMKTNPEGTLSGLAEMGIKQVELPMFTNVGSIASMLKDYGLKPTCRHFPFACISGNRDFYSKYNLPMLKNFTDDTVIEDANKYALKHLVMPNLFLEERGNIDHYKKIAEQLNRTAEKCKQAEIQLSYHNHLFEFKPIDGVLPYDILVTETDENLLSFQIDVYFLYAMGLDPVKQIKNMGSRVKLLHLKDMNKRNANSKDLSVNQPKDARELRDETVALGSGLLDFKSILTAARETNVENCYIEVEGAQSNSLEVIKQSVEHIKSIGL